MTNERSRIRDVTGMRTLVVGASSGVGAAVAIAARDRGARVAVAARRVERLAEIAGGDRGSAHELDVSDQRGVEATVAAVAADFGGIDALVFCSAVLPLARVEETNDGTWHHAFAVNAVGASRVLRCVVPYLDPNGVVLVASSHDVGRPRAGLSAYGASKAALDEILRSWRAEHPELALIRAAVGPTRDTEILRGADRDLLAELFHAWSEHGQVPARMSEVADVANMLVSLMASARDNPSVVPESVHLAPRHPPS